jgi:hypothetical protein
MQSPKARLRGACALFRQPVLSLSVSLSLTRQTLTPDAGRVDFSFNSRYTVLATRTGLEPVLLGQVPLRCNAVKLRPRAWYPIHHRVRLPAPLEAQPKPYLESASAARKNPGIILYSCLDVEGVNYHTKIAERLNDLSACAFQFNIRVKQQPKFL